MKQLYLLFLVLFPGVIAAQILHFEDFESGFPEDYNLYNLDELTPDDPDLVSMADSAWTVRFISTQGFGNGEGSHGAFSVSWYEGDEGPSDDWMILPGITLQSDPYLSWTGMAITSSGDFRDQYQVFVTTNGQTIDDFITAFPIFDTGSTGEAIEETPHTISLADYAGETVYIAFRNWTQPYNPDFPTEPGNGGNELVIDNITVSEGPASVANNDQAALQVYPNPVRGDWFYIENAEQWKNASVQIYDLRGATAFSGVLTGNRIDIGALSAGVYTLALLSEDKRAVARIVIE